MRKNRALLRRKDGTLVAECCHCSATLPVPDAPEALVETLHAAGWKASTPPSTSLNWTTGRRVSYHCPDPHCRLSRFEVEWPAQAAKKEEQEK